MVISKDWPDPDREGTDHLEPEDQGGLSLNVSHMKPGCAKTDAHPQRKPKDQPSPSSHFSALPPHPIPTAPLEELSPMIEDLPDTQITSFF